MDIFYFFDQMAEKRERKSLPVLQLSASPQLKAISETKQLHSALKSKFTFSILFTYVSSKILYSWASNSKIVLHNRTLRAQSTPVPATQPLLVHIEPFGERARAANKSGAARMRVSECSAVAGSAVPAASAVRLPSCSDGI